MDVYGLPIIGPGVDYTQVRAIHQKRTLAFINHFILNTVAFLNKFSRSCELRFEKFEAKIQKLEASLNILETKLSSISGLDHVEEKCEEVQEVKPTVSINKPVDVLDVAQVAIQVEAEILSKPESKPSIVQDPQVATFFRMIQVGVPIQAVRLKMKAEGLDPSILDRPTDSASVVHSTTNEEEESDSTASSFSD